MHLNTKGLVIRTVDWRDSDRLLTVMTEDYGKITVKAQGIRRRGSRSPIATSPYTSGAAV